MLVKRASAAALAAGVIATLVGGIAIAAAPPLPEKAYQAGSVCSRPGRRRQTPRS